MTYLTVEQVAELAGCDGRHIRRMVNNQQLFAEITYNKNNRKKYNFPVDKLPDNLKKKYYRQLRAETTSAPVSGKSLEEYTKEQREQIRRWTDIVERWQAMRTAYKGSMADADECFIRTLELESGGKEKISVTTLYRKKKALDTGDIDALVERRGGSTKGRSSIPDEVWDYFLYIYLDESQHKLSACYRAARDWARENCPECADNFPSRMSFERRLATVPEAIKVLGREGKKACADKIEPYINRDYNELESNDIWIADNHTLDIISRYDGTDKTHRLSLTAFMDARSGIVVGWNVTDNPCSQSTILALRKAIMRCGVPKKAYFDNGSEFLTHDLAGRGHRKRKSMEEPIVSKPVFDRLGIELVNALVTNAKAKPIERYFETLKNDISRGFKTFCGGNILERPENLKHVLKSGDVPTDSEVARIVGELIDNVYNVGAYGGKVLRDKGKRRIDVYNEYRKTVRQPVSPEDLNLMLMRTTAPQKVGRNGVHLTISGEKLEYWDNETYLMFGQRVYVRYDPEDLREVRLYEAETDRFVRTVPLSRETSIAFDADREDVALAMSKVREVHKAIRNDYSEYKQRLSPEKRIDMLDMQIRKAQRQKGEFNIHTPKVIIPVSAKEDVQEQKAVVGEASVVKLDIEAMNRNAMKRLNK